ncbi:hypothetical protein LPJ60_003145 [Coemansia sp. RSA 2675]|nr:hypothetical protein LPJ60_003145 [Coemansia sp. RSA 2675]
MSLLLDLPDHVISRIIGKNKDSMFWRNTHNSGWVYPYKIEKLKFYSLCTRLQELALPGICSSAYIMCCNNVDHPQFTLCNGMPVHEVALANNAKYTKSVCMDVSYEYILNGTATGILSSVQCHHSKFTRVVSITVALSVGDLSNLPDEALCTSNVNSFIKALNRLFPNATECTLRNTFASDKFDQVSSRYHELIVSELLSRNAMITCAISNESFPLDVLPAISTLTYLKTTCDPIGVAAITDKEGFVSITGGFKFA